MATWYNLGTIGWGTAPTIDCNFQYERRRNGSAMEYDVWVGVNPSQTYRDFGYPIYCEVKLDGVVVTDDTMKPASPRYWSGMYELYTGWKSVANKTSGTTEVKIRLYSGSGSSRNSTYTYQLAIDPAGSDISVSPGSLGQALTVTLTKSDPSFLDTVGAECGANIYPISSLSPNSSFVFTPPVSLASENVNGTTVPIVFATDTYASDGTTFIQSKSVTVNVPIPASVKPSASIAIEDGTGNYATYGDYVQGKSTLHAIITPTLAYGSPINSYSMQADGNTYAAAEVTTPPLQATGAQSVSATVTDKRGRTSDQATAPYTVLAYAQPYLSACYIVRGDLDGTENAEGHYMVVTFSGEVTPLNNVNGATWAIRYKVAGSGTWTDYPIPSLNGVYSVSGHQEVIAAADADAFDVEVTITDDFGTVIAGSGNIPIAYTVMNWRVEGDGMAIGGINTKAGLQIYMNEEHYGDADFQGDIKQNGASLLPLAYANGGISPVTQYNDHEDGALTADTTKTKTYTVTGNGIVMASASMMSNGSSWGFERVAIELNNNIIAEGSDAFTSSYAGQYGSSCSAFLIVTTGDVIKLTCRSNRYAAGNTYDAYYNVLALGCTLS